MTRHYTHVGELAAGRAVAALPSVMSQEAPIGSTNSDQNTMLQELKTILNSMVAANWKTKQAKALALLTTTS